MSPARQLQLAFALCGVFAVAQCGVLSTGNILQCSKFALQLDCANDCISQHNATGGQCNANRDCICRYPGDQFTPAASDTPALIPINDVIIRQCDNTTVPPEVLDGFSAFCNFDCKCNHAAESGTCNWNIKACRCNYPQDATFDGLTSTATCPCDLKSVAQQLKDVALGILTTGRLTSLASLGCVNAVAP